MTSNCSSALLAPSDPYTAQPDDTSMENLVEKLFEFLKAMSQGMWKLSTRPATEQAQPQEETLLEEDLDECIYEKILEWARGKTWVCTFYDEPALKLHEKYGIESRIIKTAYLKK